MLEEKFSSHTAYEYHKAQRLFEYHSSGMSPKHPKLQRCFAGILAKKIDNLEKQYPTIKKQYQDWLNEQYK